jgi:hypothetical protein
MTVVRVNEQPGSATSRLGNETPHWGPSNHVRSCRREESPTMPVSALS